MYFIPILIILSAECYHKVISRLLPAGAGYVGAGYNVLHGNPDGEHFVSGGPDHGLLPTKIILEKILPMSDYCPEQSICTEVATDVTDDQWSLITDLQQYQRLFSNAWDFDTNELLLPIEGSFAGSKSPSVTEAREIIETDKDVVLDKRKITTVSEVRYNYRENTRLRAEFVLELCDLPLCYATEPYRRFLSNWGTHIMVGAKLGIIDITRFKMPFSLLNNVLLKIPFLNKIAKLDPKSSMISYNSSDFQDLNTVQTIIDIITAKADEMSPQIKKWKFSSGSAAVPTPVHSVLRRLDFFITKEFLQQVAETKCPQLNDDSENIKKLRENIKKALFDYPILSAAPVLFPFTRSFRLGWPKGTYAIIKNGNCPDAGPSRVWYGAGTLVLTDSLQMYTESLSPTEFDMELTPHGQLKLKFCVKLADSSDGCYDWPTGSYCVFKKKDCPDGFSEGSVSTVRAQATLASAALPDGLWDGYTNKLEFCCRSDRPVDQPMIMPSSQPFTLLSVGSQCQKIQGMQSSLRIQSLRRGTLLGSYPFITSTDDYTMRIHFCYYTPRENCDDLWT